MENLRLAFFDDEAVRGDRLVRDLRWCQIGVERFADVQALTTRLPMGNFDVVLVASTAATASEAMQLARAFRSYTPFVVLTDDVSTALVDAVVLDANPNLPELLGAIEGTINRRWRRISARVAHESAQSP